MTFAQAEERLLATVHIGSFLPASDFAHRQLAFRHRALSADWERMYGNPVYFAKPSSIPAVFALSSGLLVLPLYLTLFVPALGGAARERTKP